MNWFGRVASASASARLAALGAGEVLVGVLAMLSPSQLGRVAGAAAESTALQTAVVAVGAAGTQLAVLATVAGAVFFGYTVYEFLPRAFPDDLGGFADARTYRVGAAVLVVASAETYARVLPRDPGTTYVTGIVLALTVGQLIAAVAYAFLAARDPDRDLETAATKASDRLDVTGATDDSTTGIGATVRVGVLLAAPLPFLAIGVYAAGLLFPVPELLAIAWAVVDAVDSRGDRRVADALPGRDGSDVEGRALELAANVLRSQKGIPVVQVSLLGFGGALVVMSVLNAQTPRFAREGLAAVSSNPLFAAATLGMVAVLLSASAFAIWFWVRTIKRLPAYLRAWNERHADATPLGDEDLPDAPTRPVGLLAPVTATFVPAMAFTQLLRYDFYFGARTTILAGYALVATASLALLAWAVLRTHRTDPQPPLSEGRALPFAVGVEWLVFLLVNPVVAFVARAADVQFPPSGTPPGFVYVLLAMSAFLFWYPDLSARAADATGWRARQHQLAMAGVGTCCAVAALVNVPQGYGFVLGVTATLFVGSPAFEVGREKLTAD